MSPVPVTEPDTGIVRTVILFRIIRGRWKLCLGNRMPAFHPTPHRTLLPQKTYERKLWLVYMAVKVIVDYHELQLLDGTQCHAPATNADRSGR